jgi:hypothetical protein
MTQATGILVQFVRVAGAFCGIKFGRGIFAAAVAPLDAVATRAAIVFAGPSQCPGTAFVWHGAGGNGSVRVVCSQMSYFRVLASF